MNAENIPFLDESHAAQLDQIVLPAVQVYHAERLASAFSHEWGGFQIPFAEGVGSVDAVKLGDIYRDTRRSHVVSEGWQTGISYPHVDEAGNIVHVTMTGRTEWEVAPNGYVAIAINRPNGTCLQARLEGVYGGGKLSIERGEVPFGTRHLDALHKALSAVCKRWMVLQTIAPLWAQGEANDKEETRQAEMVVAQIASIISRDEFIAGVTDGEISQHAAFHVGEQWQEGELYWRQSDIEEGTELDMAQSQLDWVSAWNLAAEWGVKFPPRASGERRESDPKRRVFTPDDDYSGIEFADEDDDDQPRPKGRRR